MRKKKFKILIFSKMAPTILIEFCGFIVHSKPNNTTLSAFPGKIPGTRKIVFLIFCPSPNVVPKPTDQSCSNSISGVPLQIFSVSFFYLPSKWTVVHIRKKLKMFVYWKNCFNDIHKILWIYSTFEPQQYDTIGYSRKILQNKKKNFYPSPSLATKPTD